VILLFKSINDQSVINSIFSIAGYTYGPLLGMFAFGVYTTRLVKDRWVPLICLISPIICYILSTHSESWLNGYRFGFELLILNGGITFLGLFLTSKRSK
jgi:hypothetical protein